MLEQSSLSRIKEELRAYLKEKFRDFDEGLLLEQPRRAEHGHLAWPLFNIAKKQKTKPQQLALELSQQINESLPSFLKSCEPLSGFVNFSFPEDYIQKHLKTFMNQENLLQKLPNKEHWVLDFASPNVAKYMNIGHLRATVLGQALVNLAKAFGLKVTAINHLGDWGSQFGKLLWAYKKWGTEYDFKNKAFESLVKLYVRFHDEADLKAIESAREMFKKLEEGDEDLKKLWQFFVDLSLENYSHYWKLFNVKHDLVLGESFYVPFVKDLKKRLNQHNLLKESEGAEVVFLEDNEVPCLISKSDGASTYSARDLCSMIYRFEKLEADRNIYITGSDQLLHFKQIFEVMKKLEPRWDNCHLSFGMYRFAGEGKMSTRKGKAVYIEEIVQQAIDRVKKIIKERELSQRSALSLEEKACQEIAEQVGVGALIFNDLMQDRIKDVDFNWNKVLDFEGNSGPFVQYSLVRARSLLKKSNFPEDFSTKNQVFSSAFEEKEEIQLAWLLLQFESVCFESLKKLKPHLLARYLLGLSKEFNRFYNSKKILGHSREKDLLQLTQITARVLDFGLKILNIARPTAM